MYRRHAPLSVHPWGVPGAAGYQTNTSHTGPIHIHNTRLHNRQPYHTRNKKQTVPGFDTLRFPTGQHYMHTGDHQNNFYKVWTIVWTWATPLARTDTGK